MQAKQNTISSFPAFGLAALQAKNHQKTLEWTRLLSRVVGWASGWIASFGQELCTSLNGNKNAVFAFMFELIVLGRLPGFSPASQKALPNAQKTVPLPVRRARREQRRLQAI